MIVTPTVSVVIPCYNSAPFLRETLDSVMKQTRPVLEVIVVDDGSTDDSGAIAASYGPPVRVIHQENQGESVARNRGMDEARGDWIALLDADDRWLPHKLKRVLDALREAAPDVVCAFSDIITFGSVERRAVSCPLWPVESERRVRMLTTTWVYTSNAVFLKAIGRKVRFPVGISHGEDRVFWFQLFHHGSFLHVPEPLTELRKSSQQQTAQPCHELRAIASMWNWANEHPEEFTAVETQLFRRILAEMLVVMHDKAFWHNDLALVEQTRSLYRETAPQSAPLPPLFERESPTWTLRTANLAWNRALDMLPIRLRDPMIRVSRSLVDRLKRGRAAR